MPHRRTPTLRAQLAQALVAGLALIGGVSMSGIGRGDSTRATIGDRLGFGSKAPVVRHAIAPVTVQAALAATNDSIARITARLAAQGYAVSGEMAATIARAARRHDISLDVAFGLVRTESEFKNHATSRVGAIGLAQLMPRTAAWLRPGTTRRDLRDPAINVDLGFGYLKSLRKRYDGDMAMALLAYNRGPGTVDKVLKRGGNPDNGYATKVLALR